tara:strand:- start:44021 stop:44254 length:234 start_codon:yes stop_codon:yes gene_type:complete
LAEQPPVPEELGYLLDAFMEVKGVNPLTYTELKSWSDLNRIQLLPWEVDVITTLDRIQWRILNERRVSQTPNKGGKP